MAQNETPTDDTSSATEPAAADADADATEAAAADAGGDADATADAEATGDADAADDSAGADGPANADGSDEDMAAAVDQRAGEMTGEEAGGPGLTSGATDPIAQAEEHIESLDMDAERKKVDELSKTLAPE